MNNRTKCEKVYVTVKDMSKLNEKEQKAIDLTIQLWSALLDLEVEHADDINEHRVNIHNIQNRIGARPTFREINKEIKL